MLSTDGTAAITRFSPSRALRRSSQISTLVILVRPLPHRSPENPPDDRS